MAKAARNPGVLGRGALMRADCRGTVQSLFLFDSRWGAWCLGRVERVRRLILTMMRAKRGLLGLSALTWEPGPHLLTPSKAHCAGSRLPCLSAPKDQGAHFRPRAVLSELQFPLILLFLFHPSRTSVPILKATIKSYSLSMAHLVQWGFGFLGGFFF